MKRRKDNTDASGIPATRPATGRCPFKHAASALPEPKLGAILSWLREFSNQVRVEDDYTRSLAGGDYMVAPSFARLDRSQAQSSPARSPSEGVAHSMDEIHHAYRNLAKRFLFVIDKASLPEDLNQAMGDFRRAVAKNYHAWTNRDRGLEYRSLAVESARLSHAALEVLEDYEKRSGGLPVVLADRSKNEPIRLTLDSKSFMQLFALGWSGTSQQDSRKMPLELNTFLTDRASQVTNITEMTIPVLYKKLASALQKQAGYSQADAGKILIENGLAIDHAALRNAIAGDVRALQAAEHYIRLRDGSGHTGTHAALQPLSTELIQYLHLDPAPYQVANVKEAVALMVALLGDRKAETLAGADTLKNFQERIGDDEKLSATLVTSIRKCIKAGAHDSVLALKPALPEKLQAMIPEPGMTMAGKHAAGEKSRRACKEANAADIGRS